MYTNDVDSMMSVIHLLLLKRINKINKTTFVLLLSLRVTCDVYHKSVLKIVWLLIHVIIYGGLKYGGLKAI
jgi:hypothetical protein